MGSKIFSCLILTGHQILVRTYRLPNHAGAFKTLHLWCLCKGLLPSRKTEPATAGKPLGFNHVVPCFRVCPELDTLGLKVLPGHNLGSSCEPCYAVAFTEVPLNSVLHRRVTQSPSTKADADAPEGNQSQMQVSVRVSLNSEVIHRRKRV